MSALRLYNGDYVVIDGALERDELVKHQCDNLLRMRKGTCASEPDAGSELHTIRTVRDGRARAGQLVLEALQPMVELGLVLEVVTGDVVVGERGRLGVPVTITTPSDSIDLGLMPLGGVA